MANDISEILKTLIYDGSNLKSEAGNLFGTKRGNISESDYISWKQLCVNTINKLGKEGINLINDIENYPNILFPYEDSIDRIIGNLKAASKILEQHGGENLKMDTQSNNNVFIIHGHDNVTKLEVARVIEHLGLKACILHEQSNKGRTIIEKIEAHSETVDFAIALLTPDDKGYPKDKPDQESDRARQNVVFELGFFIGSIGRPRVVALYKNGVELPSDYNGIAYISFDDPEGWKLKLARELKEIFSSIDFNLLR